MAMVGFVFIVKIANGLQILRVTIHYLCGRKLHRCTHHDMNRLPDWKGPRNDRRRKACIFADTEQSPLQGRRPRTLVGLWNVCVKDLRRRIGHPGG
jgi:hypothetical protein